MKKVLMHFTLAAWLVALLFASGCSKSNESELMKVGMVTDTGTIDDKSFNQGTWEGILKAVDEEIISGKYLKPTGSTEADYLKEIVNLYDAGYRMIITPGFKFSGAIFVAQSKYPDANFVLLDASPHNGDFNAFVAGNTVSIYFAEHESGFYAGIATAMQLGTGSAGFIGGMEIPPVQKYNWGFQQGIAYANENLGTNISMEPENVVYQGSFENVAAGQQLSAGMFEKGVDVIFCAAGGVGVGVINEAKARGTSGENIWVVGVDVDQYTDGIYEAEKSIILTSAMKKIDRATYDVIHAQLEDDFPGGQTLLFDSTNDGVGIPEDNPNLDESVSNQINDLIEMVKNGNIVVSDEQGTLIK